MEIFWTKCLTQEVGSCFPHCTRFYVSLLYCVQGVWLGRLCFLSVLLVLLNSCSSQHPFRSQGKTLECSGKHPNLFCARGMPWQGACWGALQDRWGYFSPSPGKKGEKLEVGTSFKSKATSSSCAYEGSTLIAHATSCRWCRAALMALPFSLQSEDVRWALCSPWWFCCGSAPHKHSPSEELPTFMGIEQASQTHTPQRSE